MCTFVNVSMCMSMHVSAADSGNVRAPKKKRPKQKTLLQSPHDKFRTHCKLLMTGPGTRYSGPGIRDPVYCIRDRYIVSGPGILYPGPGILYRDPVFCIRDPVFCDPVFGTGILYQDPVSCIWNPVFGTREPDVRSRIQFLVQFHKNLRRTNMLVHSRKATERAILRDPGAVHVSWIAVFAAAVPIGDLYKRRKLIQNYVVDFAFEKCRFGQVWWQP
jgi:hypothetical protein